MNNNADVVVNGKKVNEMRPGDRILRNETIEFLKTKKGEISNTEEWKMENFFKGNVDELQAWMTDLDIYEKGFLYSIAPFVGYEDCCIKHKNNTPMTFEGMLKITGVSRGKLSETVSRLRGKGIIFKGESNNGIEYFVNPWFFCRGKRVNEVLKTMFNGYRIKTLNDVAWGDIGKSRKVENPLLKKIEELKKDAIIEVNN
jgi:hypothetical protein